MVSLIFYKEVFVTGVCLCHCSALIKLLQESVGIEACSPQFLELIMKVNNCCLFIDIYLHFA